MMRKRSIDTRMTLHVREERRRRYLQRKTGQTHPMCLHCGHDDPFALDEDHTAGRAYGPERRVLCANCHRRRNAEQVDHPACPPDAETRTRDVVWARRYLQSWSEACDAADPHLERAWALLDPDAQPVHLELLDAMTEMEDEE
jgi:hypothetical protein